MNNPDLNNAKIFQYSSKVYLQLVLNKVNRTKFKGNLLNKVTSLKRVKVLENHILKLLRKYNSKIHRKLL